MSSRKTLSLSSLIKFPVLMPTNNFRLRLLPLPYLSMNTHKQYLLTMKAHYSIRTCLIGVSILGLFAGALFISGYFGIADRNVFCSSPFTKVSSPNSQIQLQAILHYATSNIVPQQNINEIKISLEVLKTRSPCNFLVFGLGHDSLMWTSFNPAGETLFLEEDPKWFQAVIKNSPMLRAHSVKYQTQLSEADKLLSSYRSEPLCSPEKAFLKGNTKCRLALSNLPDEVYEKEWDLIMIDAPKGYFPEAPGRMGAIFSAAVMARNRKGSGPTHVFLHDVDRNVEKTYAEEFLCKKHLVNGVGRLWHFVIPAAANATHSMNRETGASFC